MNVFLWLYNYHADIYSENKIIRCRIKIMWVSKVNFDVAAFNVFSAFSLRLFYLLRAYLIETATCRRERWNVLGTNDLSGNHANFLFFSLRNVLLFHYENCLKSNLNFNLTDKHTISILASKIILKFWFCIVEFIYEKEIFVIDSESIIKHLVWGKWKYIQGTCMI